MGITLSPEEITIIGFGVTLLIAVITGHIALVRHTSKLPTREEMKAMRKEISDEIKESEARIIKALVNHRHPEDGGPPVFTEPV